MAISLSKKGRMAVKEQGSGWGTAETSFSSTDYIEVEAPFIPPLVREDLSVDVLRPDNTAPTRIAGSKALTTFTLRMPLHGGNASTPSGDPTIHPDATILKALLGGGGSDGYNTCTGGTAAIPTFGTLPAATVGYGALYTLASGYSWGWHSLVTANTSSDLLVDLSAAPSAAQVYGSYTVWLATTLATPLSISWLGSDANAAITFYDCLPTKGTITLSPKKLPMLEVDFVALNWSNLGTGGAPSDYAYSYPMIPAFLGANGARVLFAGGSATCTQDVVIEINQPLTEAACASGNQGVNSLVHTDRNVTVTMTRNVSDMSATPWTDTAGTTAAALQIDACTTPGRGLSAVLCAPQVKSQPTPIDNGGLIAITTVYEPLFYSADTNGGVVAAPGDTAFRIAFG
jgi:hypothetical protein